MQRPGIWARSQSRSREPAGIDLASNADAFYTAGLASWRAEMSASGLPRRPVKALKETSLCFLPVRMLYKRAGNGWDELCLWRF